ncbi:hypothetical protein BDV95DRAFT_607042 [Massariosphaeria phaeospora]|uniref:RING-type domain-containing protein n=1 Tax=Massariosphaeria phaeospora TaxID=100035 RepID=A0A7C8M8F2_9PLEO|nr:hypothetical protein BDV95DRAFT_607042 [Massariosphaeria phaeospora]
MAPVNSREEFEQRRLERLTHLELCESRGEQCDHNEQPECAICKEPFDYDADSTHFPARVTGISECRHVFGNICIRTWLDHAGNTCPLCRTVWFWLPSKRLLLRQIQLRFLAHMCGVVKTLMDAGVSPELIMGLITTTLEGYERLQRY